MGLERIRKDWTRLGAEDPLWAVLVTPEARGDRWRVEDFLATGRAEVDRVVSRLEDLGHRAGGRALDFGCGAGRLSLALRRRFDEVVGVDFSAPMLERARALDPEGSVSWVLNEREDLSLFDDASFDLAYSSLVLQHIPTPDALRYVSELVRVVRPGGVLAIQVATRPDTSLKGRVASVLPLPVIRFVQRRLLRYPAPMDMYAMAPEQVRAAIGDRGKVVATEDERESGSHWVNTRYLVERL